VSAKTHELLTAAEIRSSQLEAAPTKPNCDSRWLASKSWSMVSKAAEMSRTTIAVIFLASAAAYTVFMTCSNAISVEVGGSILTKFGSLMLNSLPITAKWSS